MIDRRGADAYAVWEWVRAGVANNLTALGPLVTDSRREGRKGPYHVKVFTKVGSKE